jgi:hypothetical protein
MASGGTSRLLRERGSTSLSSTRFFIARSASMYMCVVDGLSYPSGQRRPDVTKARSQTAGYGDTETGAGGTGGVGEARPALAG